MHRQLLTMVALVGFAAAGCGSGTAGSESAGSPLRSKEVANAAFTGVTDVLQPGWNAVGLRGLPVTSLSGTNIAGFAYWDGTAYQTKSLTVEEVNANGGTRRGLWVFATGTGNITYSATDPTAVSLDLKAGWNLVAFPNTTPLQGHDFVARTSPTTIVPLGQVLLPQFNEIQPDRTYRQVDVTTGGSVQPGKAYWVFASQSVALSYGGSTPTPSPSPGTTPTPASSPSPGATPTPAASPSPGASPTPASSPSASPAASPSGSPLGSNNIQRIAPDVPAVNSYDLVPGEALSADGNFVVYNQSESGSGAVGYVADISGGTRQQLKVNTDGFAPSHPVLSSDASAMSYWVGGYLSPLTLQGQIIKEIRATMATSWVSQENQDAGGQSSEPRLSSDGRFILYKQGAPSVSATRLLVRDTVGGGVVLNITSATNGAFSDYDISDDGRYIAIDTVMQLVPEDTDTRSDLYLYDRQQSTYKLIAGDNNSIFGFGGLSLSASGRYLVFVSQATNIVPGTSAEGQIYRFDNDTNTIVKVSTTAAGADTPFNCYDPCVSLDGRYVAFETTGGGLVPGDTDGSDDIYVKDVTSGAIARVSVKADGAEDGGVNRDPQISHDGTYVVFKRDGGPGTLIPGELSNYGLYRARNVLK